MRYDDKLAGFGVRVMPSGRRFYFVRYRNKYGRSRWFTIGEHGKVTADVGARQRRSGFCRRLRLTSSDPSGEREAFRAAPTVSTTCSTAISPNTSSGRTGRVTRESFKGIVERDLRPELGQHEGGGGHPAGYCIEFHSRASRNASSSQLDPGGLLEGF